jgi:hypothetical protein
MQKNLTDMGFSGRLRIRVWHIFTMFCLSTWLIACGGGESTTLYKDVQVLIPAPESLRATRVEVLPVGLVLRPGDTAMLSAKVFDQTGAEMSGQTVVWSATTQAVSVGADGHVIAGVTIDSAQISAAVGAVKSLPVTALVARPVTGARMVSDAEVLVDSAPVDNTQTGRPGSQYTVRLSGLAPTVGQIVLASGGKQVAGRVLSTTPATIGNDVVFSIVGLTEVFDQAKIVSVFDGSKLPVQFPSGSPIRETLLPSGAVERQFTLNIPNASMQFRAAFARSQRVSLSAASRNFNVGPLKCVAEGSATPSFTGSSINVTQQGSLGMVESTFIVDGGAAYAKVRAEGVFGVRLDGSVKMAGELNGSVKCGATLVTVPVPVPPQVALIVQPVLPLGFSFSAIGQVTSPGLELKLNSEVNQPIVAGFELLPDGTLENLSTIDTTQQSTSFNWNIQADAGAPGFNFDASARAGLFVDAALTNVFVTAASRVLDFDPNLRLIEGFAGFNTEARLKPIAVQLQNPSTPSLYNVKFRATVGTSSSVNQALQLLGSAVSATSITNPEFKWEPTLVRSPNGAGLSSLFKFQTGDALTLSVILAPDSVKASFLGAVLLPYNVKRVEIWRKEADGSATKVSSRDASSGDVNFSMNWNADQAGELTTKYYAAVVPLVGDSFPLLLGELTGWQAVRQLGTANRDEARGFGWDNQGRVYVALATSAATSYVSPSTGALVTLPAYGGWDAQVLRYNSNGSVTGGLAFGGAGDDVTIQMRRGPDGALYAIGSSAGSSGSQTGSPVAFQSAWIAKIDVSGVEPRLMWRRQIGVRNEFAFGMDFGADGSIYTASTLSGAQANVGGTAFGQECGSRLGGRGGVDDPNDCGDVVVTRMTTDGDVIWRAVDSRPGWQNDASIAVRGSTVYVVSNTYCEIEDASVTEDPTKPCKSNDWRDPANANFLTNIYNLQMVGVTRIGIAGGAFSHVKTIKSLGESGVPPQAEVGAYTLAISDAGTPIIGGQRRLAETGYVNRTNASRYFLAALDSNGNPAWTKFYGGSAPGDYTLNSPRGLVRAADGDYYAAFASTGSPYAPSKGGTDLVVLKIGQDGTERWGVQFGSPGDERALGLDLDFYGNVFVYGSTTGGSGAGLSASTGERDAFWLKLSPRGQIQTP